MKILKALGQVKELWKNLGTLTAITASSLTAVWCCVGQCLPAWLTEEGFYLLMSSLKWSHLKLRSILLWRRMTPTWKGTVRNLPSHALPDGWQIWVWMCTQGAKELLESVSRSLVVKSSCSSATCKTTQVTQENLLTTTVSSNFKSQSGRPSTSCFGRQKPHPTDRACPQQMSKKSTLDAQTLSVHLSLYSISHGSLILSDASDMGFLPLTWVQMHQPQQTRHSTRPPFTHCTGIYMPCLKVRNG